MNIRHPVRSVSHALQQALESDLDDVDSVRYEQLKRLWGYRRPVLQFVSVTTVDVEPNDPASTTTRGTAMR